MSNVVALLDRPSRRSMGAVPFVSTDSSATLVVHGLSNSPARSIVDADLQELVRSNQAIRFRPPTSVDLPSQVTNPVAMWIGRGFEAKASALGVPVPPLPAEQVLEASDGCAAIANSEEVYARLETWLERAFRAVIADSNAPLAGLMTQVIPAHEFTQAALWHSAESEQQRSQELEWSLRLRRDAGKPAVRRDLERRFKTLCRYPPWARVKAVVLVSGLAGTRHGEAAQQLTRTVGAHVHDSSMVSFGRFLRKRWQELHGEPATKRDLQKFGQEQVDAGPFLFARQVLSQTHTYPKLLVVDGVRHRVVKEAIEFIVNRPTLDLAVEAPEELVIRHLTAQVGAAEVSHIREAQTEQEAQELLAQVSQRISYTDSDAENQREVDRASSWALEKIAAAG